MKYILNGNTVTVNAVKGLCHDIVDISGTGSVVITGQTSGLTFTLPGGTPLPIHFHYEDIELAATGTITVEVIKSNANHEDVKLFDADKPKTAGHYPGKWGTGIGSKTKGPF